MYVPEYFPRKALPFPFFLAILLHQKHGLQSCRTSNKTFNGRPFLVSPQHGILRNCESTSEATGTAKRRELAELRAGLYGVQSKPADSGGAREIDTNNQQPQRQVTKQNLLERSTTKTQTSPFDFASSCHKPDYFVSVCATSKGTKTRMTDRRKTPASKVSTDLSDDKAKPYLYSRVTHIR